MTEYKCKRCSYKEKGTFKFFVMYDSDLDAEATRCPKCGGLASGPEVIKL